MNIEKSALRATSFLTAASAVLWLGSAAAAPLPTAYPSHSAALFASVMQDPADDIGGSAHLSADLQRQVVPYATAVAAGTIIIDTSETYLYYVLGNGQAIRYVVGVGRAGQQWAGTSRIDGKYLHPAWAPPPDIKRENPRLPDVIPGGSPHNPMGVAALTLIGGEYAIHGTNTPGTVGHFVSHGCIRMYNQDITDLYQRVAVGTTVVVTR
jgi:lipoprotein-anchoring transpeptidase ErfK/SrfK